MFKSFKPYERQMKIGLFMEFSYPGKSAQQTCAGR